MKTVYIHGILLDGSENMEPQVGMAVITEGEKIIAIEPQQSAYEGAQVVDLIVWNTANLDGQSGGHLDLAAAEQTGSLGDALALLRGDLAVAGDHADVEAIRITLIL